MKEFTTIEDSTQTQLVEKKSKFIARFIPVDTAIEAEEAIRKIRKDYFDARHHCIAYRIMQDDQIIEKCSDDGEPSGTAGQPMLSILQKNEFMNVLIVVTRYFGGTLLGTGGLVRAYSDSLLQSIEQSSKIGKVIGQEIQVILEYPEFENFKYYCKNHAISIETVQYEENIVCLVSLELHKKMGFLHDFETKTIILKDLKELSKKYIKKSISI